MTTSGTYSYSNTVQSIIRRAMRIAGVLGAGFTPEADDYDIVKTALNQMIKNWAVYNIGLWTQKDIYVFLQKYQQSYLLGPAGDHAAMSIVAGEIATDAVAGAGTITVADDTGITSGDNIGVKLDDGTMQWTMVNGVPTADVVTLTAVLTDDAASGNAVYAYTSKPPRPLKILDGRIYVGGDEFMIEATDLTAYNSLPNKADAGQVNQYAYDPQTGNGVLYVWPTTDSVANYLILPGQIAIQDMIEVGEDIDIPQEWERVIATCLADEICLEFVVEAQHAMRIKARADELFAKTWGFDRENVSTQFVPNRR